MATSPDGPPMALSWGAPQVIPIFHARPGYCEWVMTIDGQDFCVLNECICSHDTGHMWEASSPHLLQNL